MCTPKGVYIEDNAKIPVIFGSGYSIAVSPCKVDFGNTLQQSQKSMIILGSTVSMEGEGTVRRVFQDGYGVKQVIRVKSCYIPTSTVRLFVPQQHLKQTALVDFPHHTLCCFHCLV